jgi:hypothetical protein
MSEKSIDLSMSVYELCKNNPELADLLYELGFKDIKKPGMLTTVGRFMTIEKGAAMKKLDMDMIKAFFRDKGYNIS